MSDSYTVVADKVVSGMALLREAAPDTRTKELMALAIGITTHCPGCVAYHTRAAHKAGASRQEVVEKVAPRRRPRG